MVSDSNPPRSASATAARRIRSLPSGARVSVADSGVGTSIERVRVAALRIVHRTSTVSYNVRTIGRERSMIRLTNVVLGHKRLVLGFWLAVIVAAFAAVGPAGDSLSQQFSVPGREGFETNREVAATYGNGGDVAPLVPVVALPHGKTVDSPGVAHELDAALARVEAALPQARTASYASTGDRAFVSNDGRTTFALV